MRKDEAFNLLCLIEAVYPLIIINSETVTRWLTLSEMLDYNEVRAKLYVHIQNMPYPPRLFDIAVFNSGEGDSQDLMKTEIKETHCDERFETWQKEYFIRNQ